MLQILGFSLGWAFCAWLAYCVDVTNQRGSYEQYRYRLEHWPRWAMMFHDPVAPPDPEVTKWLWVVLWVLVEMLVVWLWWRFA